MEVEVGVSPFRRRLRTKQESIVLFWLAVATSVWNLKEVDSRVALRSEHAAQTPTRPRSHSHAAAAAGMRGMPR